MEFTTKHLTLSERVELNNLMDIENIMDMSGTKVVKQVIRKFFGYQVKAVLLGLETLNGKAVDKDIDEAINELSNTEITEIAQQVFDETNFSKKKKS